MRTGSLGVLLFVAACGSQDVNIDREVAGKADGTQVNTNDNLRPGESMDIGQRVEGDGRPIAFLYQVVVGEDQPPAELWVRDKVMVTKIAAGQGLSVFGRICDLRQTESADPRFALRNTGDRPLSARATSHVYHCEVDPAKVDARTTTCLLAQAVFETANLDEHCEQEDQPQIVSYWNLGDQGEIVAYGRWTGTARQDADEKMLREQGDSYTLLVPKVTSDGPAAFVYSLNVSGDDGASLGLELAGEKKSVAPGWAGLFGTLCPGDDRAIGHLSLAEGSPAVYLQAGVNAYACDATSTHGDGSRAVAARELCERVRKRGIDTESCDKPLAQRIELFQPGAGNPDWEKVQEVLEEQEQRR